MARSRNLARAAAALVLGGLLLSAGLSGCTSNDSLADQYRSGSDKQYIAGDGSVTEIPVAKRKAVSYAVSDSKGNKISSTANKGSVVVVNFWYAACAPCRAEAPALRKLSAQFAGDGVKFIGVNVRDGKDTAQAFTDNFKLNYPTVLDSVDRSGGMLLAFSGQASANAVPTTLVLDKQSRVAARVLGEANESVLASLITDTVGK